MAEEEKPKPDNLMVKAIAAVFLTVLAPILVAAGLKVADMLLESAKANAAKTNDSKTKDPKPEDPKPEDPKPPSDPKQPTDPKPPVDPLPTDNADFALSFDGKSYVTLPKQLTYDGNTPLTLEARIVPASLEDGAVATIV